MPPSPRPGAPRTAPTAAADAEAPRRRPDPPRPDRPADWSVLDEALGPGQRWSTWPGIEKGRRARPPYPEFVIEDAAAVDTELGLLKTGKEADVHLLRRATPARSALLAAKRYRGPEHSTFHRSALYAEGRGVRRTRDARALRRGTGYGRSLAAAEWAAAEWAHLVRAHEAGVAVPYPVQLDGTEILMEFIADPAAPDAAAPRLHRLRPGPRLLRSYWEQAAEAVRGFARLGYAHGDLSPYNLLAAGERLVAIDLPQLVDLAGNPAGAELLARDCRTLCAWFAARGLEVDDGELLAEAVAEAW